MWLTKCTERFLLHTPLVNRAAAGWLRPAFGCFSFRAVEDGLIRNGQYGCAVRRMASKVVVRRR